MIQNHKTKVTFHIQRFRISSKSRCDEDKSAQITRNALTRKNQCLRMTPGATTAAKGPSNRNSSTRISSNRISSNRIAPIQ
ncbi:hypothetical protein PoB_001633200 [Plakobranchus ocellatus]|uniref:Uncharacterized protein n=1 Tax=Plakobranchus ocellatus TaxID=259542 RepID=A0AAV3Z5L0_9GAST|nr:hypothetical protein PoB_001633200 [Plakobranchus ocellatus]